MRVLDTNTLIYYSRRETPVTEKIERWLLSDTLLVSTVVEAELLAWPKLPSGHLLLLKQMLDLFTLVPVDSAIARRAASFRRTYRVELFDAIIAATASHYQATLVTRNVKDFAKIKEITIEKL